MDKKQKIISIIVYIAIVFFLVFIGTGNVSSPFFGDINLIDEGQIGAWMLHLFDGQHLYIDTYAAYGPFYIYPIYLISKIFGPSVFLLRIIVIVIYGLITILIIQEILKKLQISYFYQVYTILMLLVWGLSIRLGIAFLSILASYLAMEKKNYLWSMLAGLCLSSSFLVSIDMGIFATFVCLLLFIYNLIFIKNIKIMFKKLFFLFLSSMFVFRLFYFWSSREGWFNSYIYSMVDDLFTYTGVNLSIGKNFPNALQLAPHNFYLLSWVKYILSQPMFLYWLLFFYVLTFYYFILRIVTKTFKKQDMLVLLIVIFGFLLSTILIGRQGHFGFTVAPVFIIFAYYLNNLTKFIKTTRDKSEKIFSMILIFIIFAFSIRLISIFRPHFASILNIPSAVLNSTKLNYVGHIYISSSQEKSIQLIQDFITKNTKPTDKVYFFDNEPMLYFLVNRSDPTRFDLPETANTIYKRYEILNAIIKDQTKYIIYDTKAWPPDEISNSKRLPEINEYININYKKVILGNYIIYILKK